MHACMHAGIVVLSLNKQQNRPLNSPSEFHTPEALPRAFDFFAGKLQ